ncbi:hypothetical protein C7378_3319 [Acidipila rosea]|uniref:Uncharacterized protein n=1 Tax=Acidipila rosea TaxID=768535 RepID=A0A4R1KXS4_9BACT|nr:hypothetical protein C7378_3319 [Acidipila rosea]
MAGSWFIFLLGSWVGVFVGFVIASMLAGLKRSDLESAIALDPANGQARHIRQVKRKVIARLRPAVRHHHYSH